MFKKIIPMLVIIIAGEAIFMLPFLIPRLLRPLIIESWGISNTNIGLAFSAYGASALVSYFLGGPLADKYSPRALITNSLVLTSIVGAFLIMNPNPTTFIASYFCFGITTTLMMWGALIKLTHLIGGSDRRASAMGLLDSGRGLTAALMSSLLLYVLTILSQAPGLSSIMNLNIVYIVTILFTFTISIIVWFALADLKVGDENPTHRWDMKKAKEVLKSKNVWLLSLVILSSYCGYKNIDNFSVYLVDVQGLTIERSSYYTSIIFWLRPISTLIAGLVADRVAVKIRGGRFLTLSVLLMMGAITQLFLNQDINASFNIIFTTMIFSATFAYSLRAIYFAVFDELTIPNHVVGTAVGIVSVVGFLPDFFFGALTGYLIDNYPGRLGYNYVFLFTGLFLLLGSLAALVLYFQVKKVKG